MNIRRLHMLHILGHAALWDYEYAVYQFDAVMIRGRGTAVCRKTKGTWRMLNMHNSRLEPSKK